MNCCYYLQGRGQESELAPSKIIADMKFVFCIPSCFSILSHTVYLHSMNPGSSSGSCTLPFLSAPHPSQQTFLYPHATLILWLIFHLFSVFLNLQDCFCTSRTQVESLRPEKQSETSTHQNLVRKWLSTINTPLLPSVTPFYRI